MHTTLGYMAALDNIPGSSSQNDSRNCSGGCPGVVDYEQDNLRTACRNCALMQRRVLTLYGSARVCCGTKQFDGGEFECQNVTQVLQTFNAYSHFVSMVGQVHPTIGISISSSCGITGSSGRSALRVQVSPSTPSACHARLILCI